MFFPAHWRQIDVNSCKIEVHIESNFHFSVSIDVFLPFQRNKHKNMIILGV